jgi:hypothetical protein
MSEKRASPLAAAFLWAASLAAGYGLMGTFIFHYEPQKIADEMIVAGTVAAIVAHNERKEALEPT